MKSANKRFPMNLVLVIKVYGGNIEDFAVTETQAGNYDVWKYNPRINDWERQGHFSKLVSAAEYVGQIAHESYLFKKEMEDSL